MPATKKKPELLTARQREGRVVNAVAELLRNRLSVPHIYIEPGAPFTHIDLLAVDRAGSGDLHVVVVKGVSRILGSAEPADRATIAALNPIERLTQQFLARVPGHFKYAVFPSLIWDVLSGGSIAKLYSPDGIGRLGIIVVTERGEETPFVEIAVQPERFRVSPAILSTAEKKVINKVRPDFEVRV